MQTEKLVRSWEYFVGKKWGYSIRPLKIAQTHRTNFFMLKTYARNCENSVYSDYNQHPSIFPLDLKVELFLRGTEKFKVPGTSRDKIFGKLR